jgi:quercetin dioxygenase-like cupin family protein
MSKKKPDPKREALWAEAKKKCRLNAETIRMAKELGMDPRSLIKNIPSPSQQWKAPVHVWIQDLYDKRQETIAAREKKRRQQETNAQPVLAAPSPLAPSGRGMEPARAPEHPSRSDGSLRPDRSPPRKTIGRGDEAFSVSEATLLRLGGEADAEPMEWAKNEGLIGPRPAANLQSILEQDQAMLRRQQNFRSAAKAVATALGQFPAVQKVVLFGSAARPLQREVPRFQPFREKDIQLLHQCEDIDLAVWLDDLSELHLLRKAQAKAVIHLANERNLGIPSSYVDTILLEPGTDRFLGHLCRFNTCPRRKRECEVPGCGATRFLQQYADFVLDPQALAPERSEILYQRVEWRTEAAAELPPAEAAPELLHVDLFGGQGEVRVRDLLRGAAAGPFVAVLACELAPGGIVGAHRQEQYPEIVVGTAGAGRAWVDDLPSPLGPGALVWLPQGSSLRLENLSDEQPLAYLIVKAAGG